MERCSPIRHGVRVNPLSRAYPIFRGYVWLYLSSTVSEQYSNMRAMASGKSCPRGDDIWLHANALRAGFKVRQIRERANQLPLRTGDTMQWSIPDESGADRRADQKNLYRTGYRPADVLLGGERGEPCAVCPNYRNSRVQVSMRSQVDGPRDAKVADSLGCKRQSVDLHC